MARNERRVELNVRGKDEFSGTLGKLEKAQQRIIEQNRKIAQSPRDRGKFYKDTQREIDATQAKIGQLAQEFRKLAAAEGDNRQAIANLVLEKTKLQVKAGELRQSLDGVRQAHHQLRNAQRNPDAAANFKAWSQAAGGLRAEAVAAQSLNTQLSKVEQTSKRTANAQRQLAQQAGKATVAMTGARRGDSGGRRGESQDVELYGLRPYQMVNLGYQINDVISGLAMGQAPLQILAQQAGQFVQIWPQVMVALVRTLPVLGATTAALAPFITAANRLRKEAESVKQFTSGLALMADGGRYSADALSQLVTQLERTGVSVRDARQGLMSLVKDGFDQQQIETISRMARELSKITGESYESEIRRLGDAFKGGAASIRELDKELQFLTADQLEQIYVLDRQGKRTEAVAAAQAALATRLKAAKRELTPFQQAVANLTEAWNDLIDAIQNSWLMGFIVDELAKFMRDLEQLTREIKALTEIVQGLFEGPTLADQIAGSEAEIRRLEELLNQGISVHARDLGFDDASSPVNAAISDELEKAKARRDALVEAQQKLEQAAREQEAALKENTAAIREETGKETVDAVYGTSSVRDGSLNMDRLVNIIVGIESGGNPNAKNPNSSATGLGQFIESTWLNLFRKYYPEQAARMGRDAILELRKDADMSRNMIDIYIRENAAILRKAGLAVDDAAAYLAHFLGPQGAIATLRAAPGATTDQFLGADQINANASILQGKTAAEVVSWAQRKVNLTDQELAGQQRLSEIDAERAKQQADYLDSYRKQLSDQQFELEMMQRTAREAAIQKALREAELKAQEVGLALTKEQRDEIVAVTSALFDRQNAEARVNELIERRGQLAESLQIAQQAGDSGRVQEIVGQIRDTEEELRTAIDAAIAFYQALGGPAADAAILKLENIRESLGRTIEALETQFLPTAEDLNKQLSEIGGDAFSALAEAIANGESVARSFFDALRQGIAQFLIDIGRAIVQQALFNAISGGSAGGGFGGWLAGAIRMPFGARHNGGMVGAAASTRMVDPAVFANARRHHTGGLVGRERPIIALADEEVLTRDDPRHVLNGGKGGGDASVKVVNVLDGSDVLQHALASEVGERTFLNWMSRNSTAINAALSS